MGADKVLVVRLAAIGDVVMASTVIDRIRALTPGAAIHWLCGRTVAPLVEQFEGVDAVISVDEHRLLRGGFAAQLGELLSVWRRIAGAGYTRVVLLHVDARYRALVAPLVGARLSVLSRRDAHGAMNPIPGRYLGDEYARLVGGLASVGPIVGHASLARLRLPFQRRTDDGSRRRIGLIPGGARNVLRESALKRWPVERYAAVARALASDGCEIVLFGDSADAWIRPAFAGLPATDLVGQTSLVGMVGELARCDLVISHDTGPMHLARLARAPVLALFGPTPPRHFVPPDDSTTVLWGGEHLACRPCYDGSEFAQCGDNQCMTSISAEVVVRTARSMLARRATATLDSPAPPAPSESALR